MASDETTAGDIVPDDKDWTWVLERPCPDCGFDASTTRPDQVAGLVRANAVAWPPLLADPRAALRPDPATWSALEYACHVRDVLRLYEVRLNWMLDEDDPLFANWDQDATAVEERYWEQDPVEVADALAHAAAATAAAFDAVRPAQWERTGRRSNGSEFTVRTLAVYCLHDIEHHLVDVGS
jgi:DinB superfamily